MLNLYRNAPKAVKKKICDSIRVMSNEDIMSHIGNAINSSSLSYEDKSLIANCVNPVMRLMHIAADLTDSTVGSLAVEFLEREPNLDSSATMEQAVNDFGKLSECSIGIMNRVSSDNPNLTISEFISLYRQSDYCNNKNSKVNTQLREQSADHNITKTLGEHYV